MAAVVVTVIALATTTYFTNRDNSKQRELTDRANHAEQYLTRQGQITDRYTAAVDQLGSDHRDVRLGGIYSLERIMRDSKLDQPTIVEVLSAFVRDRAPLNCPTGRKGRDHPESDVQGALTVLGRRDPKHDLNKARSI
jgi:hypothetical protein